ncbi:MAG: hypothetical protein LIO93_06160, partial [Bacteroidales bacterium]|nr:hypothetical protein [Bacteroidales bacterium]
VVSWQSLLVAIGLVILFDKKPETKNAGVVLVGVGLIFLLPKIFDMNISGIIIPLLIILAGIYFIVRAVTKKRISPCFSERKNYEDFDSQSFIESSFPQEGIIRREYVFTGSKERLTAGILKGADINAVFSGVELDFTQLELSGEVQTIYIKIQSVFSGVTLYVPEEWNLIIQKIGVFGGFTDKRPSRVMGVHPGRSVVLELEAIFGGGEIKIYE